ncbi:vacuolar protein sorting-associated protein 13 [Coniophora puteana RWD-64-598 SS2]|uniref:Vacuolar protein sorting-associated protein 13 n=1 Tax=Coniophora puteana (strain RWD-64-598) TaxID=741705 RepID=A0A5M3N7A2_CONPW|nr:vacuolar protein sorting-associated protein 13 [Coniophora puteana RWD-64-598 SS2]EIW86715.1 vacuolar protein sorting-associated protein 13 [Coniophora puteana RWD-64-598 SS2]
MWWLDPGKEVLNVVFNRILAPYIENLDMNQVNYGIGQGQLTLRNLRLKKGALDKFRLPVDVLEGYLGTFTLSLHWMNLGNQPVEVMIEDVYLLVVPSPQTQTDPEEEEQRAQAAKAERLESAELLHMRGRADASETSPQNEGLWSSLTAKIINNLQITVKNIHIRYEDKLSVPGHPFAAGVTLASFTAVSVNEKWQPAFIESSAGAIHKLANLESLAVYFDTDSESMAGLPRSQSLEVFSALISGNAGRADHQFILQPVSGEGRIIVNHKLDESTPHYDIQLFFDEIGVALDDDQYRDAISLVDMYHVFIRQHQYQKYRPTEQELEENRPRALLRFAGKAIMDGVHEQRRKWTWAYFAERRDDRNEYVELFEKKVMNTLQDPYARRLSELEKKLSYEDIRFYRSIARSRLRKDAALRKKLEEERQQQQQQQQQQQPRGWTSWLWGSSQTDQQQDPAFGGPMTDEQRKELYEALDYDEKSAIADSFEAPRDALKMRAVAELRKGTLALRKDPRGTPIEIISTVFDSFRAEFVQRPDNFESSISLGGFSVFDGTTKDTLYSQIVRVKDPSEATTNRHDSNDPFFFVKFESNPLDERADTALTARMRHMEIIYHRGYVEAVWKFFKPPPSQLESVEALLSAASQTLEGLRKETRAGLEYALQKHKTVDLQVDLNAPIIIIPENITTNVCQHLVIDAGHISVESKLVDKEAIRAIQAKRNQQYGEEDYKRLESLMYDKMILRLEAAQFVLGGDLQSCKEAITSQRSDSLHLLERINVDFEVQNSIVPTALNLARFKVSGKLPALRVNISDIKYKSLMRIIDVAIPHFDDDVQSSPPHGQLPGIAIPFALSSGLFGPLRSEYTIEEEETSKEDTTLSRENTLFEETNNALEHPEIKQHTFDLNFEVERLKGVISKSNGNRTEKIIGDVTFEHFRLTCCLMKYNMDVGVKLRSLAMNLVQDGGYPLQFISSEDSGDNKDLMNIAYTRVQSNSPEYLPVFEGIDQNVDIKLSTFVFRAAPAPVIALYDFIMTTFVPQATEADSTSTDASSNSKVVSPNSNDKTQTASSGSIRVALKLDSVKILLMNDIDSIATLSLTTADVLVLLHGPGMQIAGRLGNLSLADDRSTEVADTDFKRILTIEGQNFAEFRYQTYDPNAESYTGVNSSVSLNAGSLKLHYLEKPLHDIYTFVTKLAKLKGLYDAARQAAVQRASEIDLMKFDITIKTPIVVFPSDPLRSRDALTLRLGEISAQNSFEDTSSKIQSSLRGIQLVSTLYYDEASSTLTMIDDIAITADVIQQNSANHVPNSLLPDVQVLVNISDVKMYLTQVQYGLLMDISKSIPKVLSGAPEGEHQIESSISPATSSHARALTEEEQEIHVSLEPELRAQQKDIWATVDVLVSVKTIKLHLYDSQATTESSLKEHGIARFALNDNTLRYKSMSDTSSEAQVVLKSFTMSNTRPGSSKFREIIPAAQHARNQFMILYSAAGSTSGSSLAIVTVDSPHVLFAVEPVFALLDFFTAGISSSTPEETEKKEYNNVDSRSSRGQQTQLDFRFDLHDVSVSILEDEANPNSQAIRLYIDQILLSQQGIMALSVNQLGLSLIQMGVETDTVRLLDNVDITFTLDSRTSKREQMTSMEMTAKPIIIRASYRDIMLISTIVTKAANLYAKFQGGSSRASTTSASSVKSTMTDSAPSRPPHSTYKHSQDYMIGSARVVMSKEQMSASFDGFRLILIGDMHEQPMLHLKLSPFTIKAVDWSSELQANSSLSLQISYWNLTNSHWEPLIDPWAFALSLARDPTSGEVKSSLSSRERLDLNLSTTFAELAWTTSQMWGKEGHRVLKNARGAYAPYRIRNRTGSTISVWIDDESNHSLKDSSSVKITNSQSIEWRFDDWKTMREHVTSGEHSIGVQLVGKSWEAIRGVPVDREGEYTFSLRPRLEKYTDRLLCSVKLENNVKIVTLRSTYLVENLTFYPLEVMLVDHTGHPVYSVEKIAPGQDYSLPIEAVAENRIRLQPDQGFGYRWCSSLRMEDLLAKRNLTINCPHNDPQEAPFRFQAWVQIDESDLNTRKSPRIKLKLRAPIELENLLPYNLQYRIYDKDANQNWKSYLRKGGVMPVHSVELGHLVLLNVEVQDTVFKPSDFAIINTDRSSDFDIENRLSLRDPNDRKLDLKLNYVRQPDSGGAFKVQIYSPYLVVNKTGLPFSVRAARSNRASSPQDVAGETKTDVLRQPTPFMLSHRSENGLAFVFRVGDSAWSNVFSLEAPAAESAMVIPSQRQKTEEYHFGLSWSEGYGKYKLTKVITISPRFFIKNNLGEPISVREHGVGPQSRFVVGAGERSPLQITRIGRERLLTIAYPGLNSAWSPPINIEDIGSVHFRLSNTNDQNDAQIIRANVQIDGSTIFVSFQKAEGAPFVIENSSDFSFSFCQTDSGRDDSNATRPGMPWYRLDPHSQIQYTWDMPAAREKKLLLTTGESRRVVDIMEIGVLLPFRFRERQRTRVASLDVRADGHKQVLRITHYVAENSVYKPKRQSTGSLARSDTFASSEAFEAVTEDSTPTLNIQLDLAGIGVSLINRRMLEVAYISVTALKFEYSTSPAAQAITFACNSLQIDNQLHDALYPVVLQPSPISKEVRGVAALPTIQASVIWLNDQEHGVLFVKYCSILLQALTIETDEDLLFAIYDLTQIKGLSWEEDTEDVLIRHPNEVPEPQATIASGSEIYFEVLELQPILLSLSFMRTERVSSEDKLSIRNPLAVVVNALTMTLGNINDAPLELNALAIKDMRLTFPELQTRVMLHYRQDVLRQLYRILGSADFIGNPVGLFTNVSSGVADIFYAPYNGVVMHGNKELGIGIAKGAASFVKKTVFGLSDSMTKFTSSVGKGLSAATFDSEYQAQRRLTQRRNKPRHAIYGVTAGGEAFASSFVSAMEGIVTKPIQGAESEGAFGFFKGVGKGLVGAVTKPAVGVFDLASNVSEGIRNTTTVFDKPERDRVRPPRHVPSDGVLVPYSAREAQGQYMMRDLDNGAFRQESYVAHIDTPGGDNVVLLTTTKLLSFWSKKLRLDWELPLTLVQGVAVEDTGIRFTHKSGRDHDKFIFIPDKTSQAWFFGQIAAVVKAFNNRRRMDT